MSNTLNRSPRILAAFLLIGFCLHANGQRVSDEEVLNAMDAELSRSMTELADQPNPPFYISYEITDSYRTSVGAAFGSTTRRSETSGAYYDVDLRIGERTLDNTHLEDRQIPILTTGSLATAAGIRNHLWLQTDRAFKQAIEQLVNVKTRTEIQIDSDGPAFDLAESEKVTHLEATKEVEFAADDWENRLRQVTSVFKGHPFLHIGSASVSVSRNTRYFVNSEKSRIQDGNLMYTLVLSAGARADDGSNLNLSELYHAREPAGLPTNRELTKKADALVTQLIDLRNAPKVEPYTGPAILSGRASGVLFHEILGHRLEGHRLKQTSDAQTFKDKINERILPESMSVIFDPHMRKYGDTDLLGAYTYDNEGVLGQRVEVIENGFLRKFLLGRSTLPDEDFRESNGHGRKAIGYNSIARQSNLIVEVNNPNTPEELENKLIELLKEKNLDYGLFFDEIVGGFTFTGRSLPNAFTVNPVIVYKIYQDGSRQLVRGVDLIGTPLTVFDSILAAADDNAIFNGSCGAESGWVPVSAISPSLLVGQIEVQRSAQSRTILPILPAPARAPQL